MMDSPTATKMENVEDHKMRRHSQPPRSHRDPGGKNPKLTSQLRGSGSYPTMVRARTANRNKITKRTSDSVIITGHHLYNNHHHHGHHVTGGGGGGGGGGGMIIAGSVLSEGNSRSTCTKKRKLLNNKRTVFSKASRRKSLENLGLLVRNRCGTAKLQWPSEKKETDVFDLLPEGCLQVRQLIRLKSRGADVNVDMYYFDGGGGGDCDRKLGGGGGDENESKIEGGGGAKLILSEERLRLQRPRGELTTGQGQGQTDWKNKKNISVIVRIRPKQERERVEKSIVFRTDSKTIVFDPKEKTKDFYFQGVKQLTRNDFGRKRPNRNVSFQYDKVYGPEATNKEIFEEMLRDLTDHLIEGYNSTVFAYGATGSGKTYTMIGSNSNPGLTVLMVESLYKKLDEISDDYDCEVVCSYLEVYNETIKDLLSPEKELSIREDGKKGIIISELSFYKPRGPQELLKLLRSGNRARTQHATDLNAESSRSHAVFEVKLCLKKRKREKVGERESSCGRRDDDGGGGGCSGGEDCDDDGGDNDGINKVEVIQSKLVMVDLAGSERGTAASLNSHGGVGGGNGGTGGGGTSGGFFVDGARQREGASINKSLLALASCISALADGKCHVPYRNSKLTRLLKDSLNGLSTTVMIANISPSALTSEDTYNTLKYADRAKSIVGPIQKQKNVFIEDLIIEDSAKTKMAELEVKNVILMEQLEEEKVKRELILKQLEELQRKNVEEEERNFTETGENSRVKARESITGCTGFGGPYLTEDQLPPGIQEYIDISRERANLFSDYVEFASETRFNEWLISCKKLKADMADFLGRLPVEDENYIWFSKLKNEVNNDKGALSDDLTLKKNDHQHQRYAIKLKNLTEKMEVTLSRQEISGKKMVQISLEEFVEFKRLTYEQEGNEKMSIFYQRFCQQINNQLMTSGMTLMNSLKLVKSIYLQLRQLEEHGGAGGNVLTAGLKLEYKELLDLVYGPGTEMGLTTAVPGGAGGDNNINGNVNNDHQRPLSTTPQNPPQLSNLGRKSSPVMDDLGKLRKLVERPLLIQLTSVLGTADEETEIKCEQDSTFSHFVTTSNTAQDYSKTIRKSLSTSHTIYEQPPPPPPPVTRVRGGESSPELQLSYNRRTPSGMIGEGESGESCYNDDDDVDDNDHHYLHPDPPHVINNDDDDDDGTFQVETPKKVEVGTANENWRNSPPQNIVNPVKRKNSTSFEIIFDKKEKEEEKRVGGESRRKHDKLKLKLHEKNSTPFGGPSVMSALSKQKLSENQFNDQSEDWTTTTTTSSNATSTSASGESVMMTKGNNKICGGSGGKGQGKSIGTKKRLVDQPLIKDYHFLQQTKLLEEKKREYEEEKGGESLSGFIYQVDSLPLLPETEPSSIDILEKNCGEIGSNKRGFGGGESADVGESKKDNKNCKVNTATAKTTTTRRAQNPSRGGHENKRILPKLPLAVMSGSNPPPPDIGASWRNNNHNKLRQHYQQQKQLQSNKSIGGGCDGGNTSNKSKSKLLPSVVIPKETTPPEFPMRIQGQDRRKGGKVQHQQRLLEYKVTLPGKKSIALHPSKASTDLTFTAEKVNVHQKQRDYPSEKQQNLEESGGDGESEWEVHSSLSVSSTKMTNAKEKKRGSQLSLLSSARSTMSHLKGPYHTNCKTFTISRESVPGANMPIISSLNENDGESCGKKRLSREKVKETTYRRGWDEKEKRESDANYYTSNEDDDDDDGDNNGNYTTGGEGEDYDDGVTSCYSYDCNN